MEGRGQSAHPSGTRFLGIQHGSLLWHCRRGLLDIPGSPTLHGLGSTCHKLDVVSTRQELGRSASSRCQPNTGNGVVLCSMEGLESAAVHRPATGMPSGTLQDTSWDQHSTSSTASHHGSLTDIGMGSSLCNTEALPTSPDTMKRGWVPHPNTSSSTRARKAIKGHKCSV